MSDSASQRLITWIVFYIKSFLLSLHMIGWTAVTDPVSLVEVTVGTCVVGRWLVQCRSAVMGCNLMGFVGQGNSQH